MSHMPLILLFSRWFGICLPFFVLFCFDDLGQFLSFSRSLQMLGTWNLGGS